LQKLTVAEYESTAILKVMETLTTEQQDILDNLGDSEIDESFPDNWDKEFQRSILAMLLADSHFLLMSRDKIVPRYFVDKAQRLICELLFEFYDEYNNAPAKKYLVHEITLRVDDEKKRIYFLGELNVLTNYFYPGLETRDYLQDNIVNFAQTQKIKVAFKDSMKAMKDYGVRSSETWDKVGVILRDALLLEKNFDLGLDYFDDPDARYDEMAEQCELGEKFITRMPSIDDELVGGIGRGEIAAVVSASGVGKSVFLANIATWNVLRGKRVLYLSTEMKQNKVAMRIDSIMTGISIKDLVKRRKEVVAELKRTVFDKEDKKLFMLKKFPSKSADINTFRAYHSQVQMHGFKPDLVIVDYVGEMKDYADIPKHESRERMVGDLTQWCGEEDFGLFTALQPNRTGKEVSRSGYIDDDHFGDSYGQIRPLDACWSLNQNDNEKSLGLMRGYVIKHRDGESHYPFYVHSDGKFGNCTLRMSEVSKDTYMKTLNEKKEYTSNNTSLPPLVGTVAPDELDLETLK
jgi:KaiC/GvpD/RAD55 family RecA-like ATPase